MHMYQSPTGPIVSLYMTYRDTDLSDKISRVLDMDRHSRNLSNHITRPVRLFNMTKNIKLPDPAFLLRSRVPACRITALSLGKRILAYRPNPSQEPEMWKTIGL